MEVPASLPVWTIGALACVAAVAGCVDAIAGGGGLLTVPALLATGLPANLVLGTNKGCSTWGTAVATWTYARSGVIDRRRAIHGFLGGASGSVVGACLQLAIPPKTLAPIVLVLLGLAAIAIALGPTTPRSPALGAISPSVADRRAVAIAIGMGAYDGFFGPGTGTFIIVAHVVLLGAAMRTATANAKAVNLGSNVAALVTFAVRGTVLWKISLPMALANIAGNRLGAHLAIRRGDGLVRGLVIAVTLALIIKLGHDLIVARG